MPDDLKMDPPALALESQVEQVMTTEDLDQIIDGIEEFIIGPVEDAELRDIWQPYIDKLEALKASFAVPLTVQQVSEQLVDEIDAQRDKDLATCLSGMRR